MSSLPEFYIIKRPSGTCDIVPSDQVSEQQDDTIIQKWGPFDSPNEAIARRVGLIRAGKCQPQ